MVLHYAHLAVMAGGVDAFVIGSELCGLTTLRSSASDYPFVAGLQALAADVRAVVGGDAEDFLCGGLDASISGISRMTAAGDVLLPSRSAVGRRERSISSASTSTTRSPTGATAPGHADETSGRSPYDLAYLRSNIRGGEGFDWYYASAGGPGGAGADGDHRRRRGQAVGVPLQGHRGLVVESALRPAGRRRKRRFRPRGRRAPSRSGSPSSAARRSTRAPTSRTCSTTRNRRSRRCPISPTARATTWRSARTSMRSSASSTATIPSSTDPTRFRRSMAGRWSTRRTCISGPGTRGPIPYFPECTDVWSDGANWERGHWLNGRLGSVTLVGADRRGDARPRFCGLCGRRRAWRGRRLRRQRGAVGARDAGAGAAGVPHGRGGCRRPRALPRAARGRAT